jgi:1-acyl-sn-glycerol-3-phosphate acyltransferase
MISIFIRSTIFNITFVCLSLIQCLLFAPALLMRRDVALKTVDLWESSVYWLEKTILNLDYTVKGLEHLPPTGTAYIIAAKHQSPYETMKIHRIVHDPAIIFKKELLNIPIWGQFVKKVGGIPIDRSSRKSAFESINQGALRMKEAGRPILIFPQGTRVNPEDSIAQRPYKFGVTRMQSATQLPIIPLALNSGIYWRKASWLKKSGTVTFEFLPAIPYDPSIPEKERLDHLSEVLESHCHNL